MKRWIVGSIFLALLAMPGLSHGKEEKKPATTLEEVVISASRVEEKKKEITTNVTIINEEDIQSSSARDLGDLLAEKGIGHIHKYPGTLTSIGIRGFRTETHGYDIESHVLILVDGRRAGTGNLAKIMTKNIERTEIIRGPASVQYGSAAMGGVVNVITKQGKEKPAGSVEGVLGSFGHELETIGFSGKAKGFDFSGSFTTQTMDDYDTAEGKRYYNTGYDRKENVSLNLGFEFLPRNRVGVIYHYFDVDQQGTPNFLRLNDLDDYADKKNESIDLIYDGMSSGNLLSWRIRYFEGEDVDKWADPTESNPDFWDDGIPSERKTGQKGAQAQSSLNWKNSTIIAGLDWVNYEVETTWDPKESEYDNPAYFLLAKTRLFDQRFIISGGLRYDEYEVEMKRGQGGTQEAHHLSPRVGGAYLLTDYLKLRANYGEAFKIPSAEQLAGNFPGWWGNYVGNPDLNPEKSETYEVGLDFSYESFNAGLTYFHTDFKDKIETYTMPSGDTSWKNVGKAEIEGVEGDFSYDIGAYFAWDFKVKPYVSFVYLTEYKDKETDKDLQYTSDLHMSYGITASELYGFSANLNFAYTGKQWITDYESGWPYQVIEKDSFTVANFTISRKILDTEKYGGLTLGGEIQNLFGKDYAYVKGYPMPGRSFFLGLRYDF